MKKPTYAELAAAIKAWREAERAVEALENKFYTSNGTIPRKLAKEFREAHTEVIFKYLVPAQHRLSELAGRLLWEN